MCIRILKYVSLILLCLFIVLGCSDNADIPNPLTGVITNQWSNSEYTTFTPLFTGDGFIPMFQTIPATYFITVKQTSDNISYNVQVTREYYHNVRIGFYVTLDKNIK